MPDASQLVIAGQLRRQYLLPPSGRPLLDAPGGNLLYAASGARVWADSVSLLARVGEDYPHNWLRQFQQNGLDTSGIKIIPESLDLRSFMAYTDLQTVHRTNPVSHFVRLGLSFPKPLLGYQPPEDKPASRTRANPDSPRLSEIPSTYRNLKAAHLCPLDLQTHAQLAPEFRQGGLALVTIDPDPAYMNSNYMNELRSLLQGVTAFLPSEEEIRSLFWGRTDDLWKMAETLASFGCDIIVIKRGARGQYLFDNLSGKRWEIPAYPASLVDLTGAGDAFCGGFLAGYAATLDPLQAVLQGNISASLAIEGSGVFYALDSMPGLAQARLLSLADIVRQI
jgi:sugar/nucleoside kinase (ribokinase family)